MKLKEKFQRFWTLSKSHKGFTLVELIVVIAILAILAGVAIPVYNGYIKKAQEAADSQLKDAINTAFAATCLVNGLNQNEVVGEITINENGTIIQDGPSTLAATYSPETHHYFNSISNLGDVPGAEFDATFLAFFAGNETAAFSKAFIEKNGNSLTVPCTDDENAGKVKVQYNGKDFYVSQSAINAFNNSVFKDRLPEMQGQVDTLAGFFGDFVGTSANAAAFGDFQKFLTDNNIADEDIGNAAVLYVAKNAANADPADIANMFGAAGTALEKPGAGLMDALNAVTEGGGDMLTNAAMMYAAVVGFANSDKCNDSTFKANVESVNSPDTLLGVFKALDGNEEWYSYIGDYKQDGSGEIEATEQFTNDVSGFIGAMDVLGTVSPDVSGAGNDFWSNNPEINKLLSELLGNN